MHATPTPLPAAWAAQFLYVLACFGMGLDGLSPELVAEDPDFPGNT